MHLHLDCPTGISGDMFLAAMVDLGLDLAPFQDLLNGCGLDVTIEGRPETRDGLQGTGLRITTNRPQVFRDLDSILTLITASRLTPKVQRRSRLAFQRLAEVEASVHNVELSAVHFHEVGAVDTLVDVLGCFWALEQLEVTAVSCSSLPWFQGLVDCEHGRLPLPAPATVELLRGKPVYPTAYQKEIITPTGALILDQTVSLFADGPRGRLEKNGTGWGTMDLGATPNGLRAFLTRAGNEAGEEIWVLESNLDHLSGEELGSLFSALQDQGALDFIYLQGVMKKNRPGGLLQVLCAGKDLEKIQDTFFDHSLTLGIRRRKSERVVLDRKNSTLKTRFGNLQAKEVSLKDRSLIKPEFEALQELAGKTGRSVAELRYLLSEPNTMS
ncbi:MAG: nickel pincer cofactor biosynthesis protein LarC [Desulfohalobiaceae bacterium]|nr:nickel pincer cofactor biosynthesis protein LarC [Desulfohalobiaceae bacterium]